jgi:hypothetical protein
MHPNFFLSLFTRSLGHAPAPAPFYLLSNPARQTLGFVAQSVADGTPRPLSCTIPTVAPDL